MPDNDPLRTLKSFSDACALLHGWHADGFSVVAIPRSAYVGRYPVMPCRPGESKVLYCAPNEFPYRCYSLDKPSDVCIVTLARALRQDAKVREFPG